MKMTGGWTALMVTMMGIVLCAGSVLAEARDEPEVPPVPPLPPSLARLRKSPQKSMSDKTVERSGCGGCFWGSLKVKILRGENLPDLDGWGAGHSDPVVEVTVTGRDGTTFKQSTNAVDNTGNPEWNKVLNFGSNAWKTIHLHLKDQDFSSREHMHSESYGLRMTSSTQHHMMCLDGACNATVRYTVDYTVDCPGTR